MIKLIKIVTPFILMAALSQIIGCSATKMKATSLPKGVKIKTNIALPSPVALSIYVPKNELKSQFFMPHSAQRVEPGQALANAIEDVSSQYFVNSKSIDLSSDRKFGLLLDMNPEFKYKNGKTNLIIETKLYDTNLNLLRDKTYTTKASIDFQNITVSFHNAAIKGMQTVFVDIINRLEPTLDKYPAINPESTVEPKLIADLEKPISSGTGFFFNQNGGLLTAAHVIDDCIVVKAKFDDKLYDVFTENESRLVDLAYLSSEIQNGKFLPFRAKDEIHLGESISTVGFPLKGLLDATPNLTVGNVSSKNALKGSKGIYQFSAPIQSGNSGGAIVSQQGEIIGIASSSLNSKKLLERGVISQNVNFAVKPSVITKFLDRYGIEYVRQAKSNSVENANELALNTTVQLTCYQ